MRIEIVKAEEEFGSDERNRIQNDVEFSAVG